MWFASCPECEKPMQVEATNNGVAGVWHGFHCGWAQTPNEAFRSMKELDEVSHERA